MVYILSVTPRSWRIDWAPRRSHMLLLSTLCLAFLFRGDEKSGLQMGLQGCWNGFHSRRQSGSFVSQSPKAPCSDMIHGIYIGIPYHLFRVSASLYLYLWRWGVHVAVTFRLCSVADAPNYQTAIPVNILICDRRRLSRSVSALTQLRGLIWRSTALIASIPQASGEAHSRRAYYNFVWKKQDLKAVPSTGAQMG